MSLNDSVLLGKKLQVGSLSKHTIFTIFKTQVSNLNAHRLKCFQVGTIAGNLMIKHTHNSFSSDIFLLLETVGAQLTLGLC